MRNTKDRPFDQACFQTCLAEVLLPLEFPGAEWVQLAFLAAVPTLLGFPAFAYMKGMFFPQAYLQTYPVGVPFSLESLGVGPVLDVEQVVSVYLSKESARFQKTTYQLPCFQ